MSRQIHGEALDFSGPYLTVVTFVVGYHSGFLRMQIAKNELQGRIIDAMRKDQRE